MVYVLPVRLSMTDNTLLSSRDSVDLPILRVWGVESGEVVVVGAEEAHLCSR